MYVLGQMSDGWSKWLEYVVNLLTMFFSLKCFSTNDDTMKIL